MAGSKAFAIHPAPGDSHHPATKALALLVRSVGRESPIPWHVRGLSLVVDCRPTLTPYGDDDRMIAVRTCVIITDGDHPVRPEVDHNARANDRNFERSRQRLILLFGIRIVGQDERELLSVRRVVRVF